MGQGPIIITILIKETLASGTGNHIGPSGGTAIAAALRVNTTLGIIDLSCEWVAARNVAPPTLACGTHTGSGIGAAVATTIADALRVNTTVATLDLSGE